MGLLCTPLPYPIVVASNSPPTPPSHIQLASSCICYNYVPPLENQLSHIGIIKQHSSPPDQSATDNTTPPALPTENFKSRTSPSPSKTGYQD